MFKKIQLLSLCVCALAASQVNAAGDTATINASLTIDQERYFMSSAADLAIDSKTFSTATPVILNLGGSDAAKLTMRSTKGKLSTGAKGDEADALSVDYDLTVTVGATALPAVKAADILSQDMVKADVPVDATAITVAATADNSKSLKAGKYTDAVTLTLSAS